MVESIVEIEQRGQEDRDLETRQTPIYFFCLLQMMGDDVE
jgi:hypothetical protein